MHSDVLRNERALRLLALSPALSALWNQQEVGASSVPVLDVGLVAAHRAGLGAEGPHVDPIVDSELDAYKYK